MRAFIDRIAGDLGDKKRYRLHRARIKALPGGHRTAVEGLERYLMYRGAITRGDVLLTMLDDLADLFEQAAADGATVRSVLGDDPVDFAETFLANYRDGEWIDRERQRLIATIARAESAADG